MAIPYDYQGDWSRMAQLIVHQSLRIQPGERVIIHADPTYFPELSEQVRSEIVKAGAVELCTSMLHPSGLEAVRRHRRRRQDATLKQMEDKAMAELFALADIYIWLPTSWAWNVGQTEDILKTWPGRSIHFHWIIDEADATVFRKLSEMYEASLYLDYDALAAHQERLIERLRNSTVEITNAAGTELRFRLQEAHFHRGNGNASKAFINGYARSGSARDREVELPAGAIRTVDITETEGRLVCTRETFAGRQVGTLTYAFRDNRITRVTSEYHDDFVQALWALETGDKDRFGEFNLGVSPALSLLPGHDRVIPYYGYGAGVVRVSLGDNQESGGAYRSSYHHWLFLTDATVKVDGRIMVERGTLVA
jgi:leucyl aminopeptidase (aminopeptidase T)